MATYQDLMAQIKQLKKEATAQRRAEKQMAKKQAKEAEDVQRREQLASAIAQVRQLMADLAVTVEDLGGARRGRAKSTGPKVKGEIRYANPAGGKGWTGKGRKPNWLVEALAQGRQLSDFEIK